MIKANNKTCDIFTKGGSFTSRVTLRAMDKPPFFQIHKSYLANIHYIVGICRYRATLKDGRELPIGKERYMALKQYLRETDEPLL